VVQILRDRDPSEAYQDPSEVCLDVQAARLVPLATVDAAVAEMFLNGVGDEEGKVALDVGVRPEPFAFVVEEACH